MLLSCMADLAASTPPPPLATIAPSAPCGVPLSFALP